MSGFPAKLHLPFDQWPAQDQLLWDRAIASDDPFGEAAGGSLATTSKHQYLFAWRRFLGFLALEDPYAIPLSPVERLTSDRVRAFVEHLAKTLIPRSIAIQVDALYKAARIMLPDSDLTWLKRIKARLHASAPTARARGPIVTSLQILEVGQRLMDQHHLKPGASLRLTEALAYRDGLMLAFLAFIPLRRKNLAALEVGRHLVQEGSRWFLVIPADETKTRSAIEFVIPDLLLPYLDNYLRVVRVGLLRNKTNNALWIGPRGMPLRYGAIGGVISRHTQRMLNIRLTPHDARDAAATTWAIALPAQVGVARDLLSHTDLRTTDKYYNRARGVEASRAHSHVVDAIKKGAGRLR
jgi:integrase/recombinase XerD